MELLAVIFIGSMLFTASYLSIDIMHAILKKLRYREQSILKKRISAFLIIFVSVGLIFLWINFLMIIFI